MSCEPIRMEDGTTVLALVKPGAKITERDRAILAEFAQFCRGRKAAQEANAQRKRNAKGGAR